MDLQLFYRDTEQVDNWMSKQEVSGVGAGHAAQLARSVQVRFCVTWREGLPASMGPASTIPVAETEGPLGKDPVFQRTVMV